MSHSTFESKNRMIMKKRLKGLCWISILIVESITGFSQAIEINAGRTLLPGEHAGFRYAHFTNSYVNLAGGIFVERFHRKGIGYQVYGMDLLAQYVFDRSDETNSPLSFTCSIGLTGQIESEPWIYKDLPLSQRINYGLLMEGSGEWMMTEVFGLILFAQQKWLFNKHLGSTAFVFGLGLRYHLNPTP